VHSAAASRSIVRLTVSGTDAGSHTSIDLLEALFFIKVSTRRREGVTLERRDKFDLRRFTPMFVRYFHLNRVHIYADRVEKLRVGASTRFSRAVGALVKSVSVLK
jgi:hypothetical protein